MWSSRVWRPVLGASCLAMAPLLIRNRKEGVSPSCPDLTAPALQEAVAKAEKIAIAFKERHGAPGVSVGVAICGKVVWQAGFGFADIENAVPMRPNTVLRIASISKPICGLLALKLVEQNQLELQKNVRDYVPEFPEKKVNGEAVTITVSNLLSHTSGVRHYFKTKEELEKKAMEERENYRKFDHKEYFIKEHFSTVFEALSLFKEDELLHAPGADFTYTTYGFTLLSAVIERAGREPFERQLRNLLSRLEMWDTQMELNDRLIPGRARHYVRGERGGLKNVPYVDNSYKWAGGGLVSNVPDLLRFSSVVLGFHAEANPTQERLVSRELMQKAWVPVPKTRINWLGLGENGFGSYGLSWGIFGHPDGHRYVLHTGGAIGVTSVLVLVPEYQLSVVILCNVQNASGIGFAGKRIADTFIKEMTHFSATVSA